MPADRPEPIESTRKHRSGWKNPRRWLGAISGATALGLLAAWYGIGYVHGRDQKPLEDPAGTARATISRGIDAWTQDMLSTTGNFLTYPVREGWSRATEDSLFQKIEDEAEWGLKAAAHYDPKDQVRAINDVITYYNRFGGPYVAFEVAAAAPLPRQFRVTMYAIAARELKADAVLDMANGATAEGHLGDLSVLLNPLIRASTDLNALRPLRDMLSRVAGCSGESGQLAIKAGQAAVRIGKGQASDNDALAAIQQAVLTHDPEACEIPHAPAPEVPAQAVNVTIVSFRQAPESGLVLTSLAG